MTKMSITRNLLSQYIITNIEKIKKHPEQFNFVYKQNEIDDYYWLIKDALRKFRNVPIQYDKLVKILNQININIAYQDYVITSIKTIRRLTINGIITVDLIGFTIVDLDMPLERFNNMLSRILTNDADPDISQYKIMVKTQQRTMPVDIHHLEIDPETKEIYLVLPPAVNSNEQHYRF